MVTFEEESTLRLRGTTAIGVDEAGRGALAGPVVAAAVVLRPDVIPAGLNDSKRLTPLQRHSLASIIRRDAAAWGIGIVSSHRIDAINILEATFEAMHLAIDQCLDRLVLHESQCHALIDGNRFRPHRVQHTTIIRGDATCASIAAASILAKTTRDELMTSTLHPAHSLYEFDRHKGYGTKRHRDLIRQLGPCPEHRVTFLSKVLSVSTNSSEPNS